MIKDPQPKIQGHSIVLLGNFNPKIFHPIWFSSQGLIRDSEAQEAEIQIIHPDAAVFSLGWMKLEVTAQRFMVQTNQEPYYEVIRDLVQGTFSLLRYTPVKSMGINRDYNFLIGDEQKWHNVGHTLAPKEIWSDILKVPGLEEMSMIGERTDGLKGFVKFEIRSYKKEEPGILLLVNNHFDIEKLDQGNTADIACNLLTNNWKSCMTEAENSVYNLLAKLL